MTLVITHTNGFLGCFTKAADGTMQQRALIDTGEEAPTPMALAELGESMAKQYGWIAPRVVAPIPSKAIAEPRVKARPKGKELVGEERNAYIMSFMRGHGSATLREIMESAGTYSHESASRWQHNMRALCEQGLIMRMQKGTGTQGIYYQLRESNET